MFGLLTASGGSGGHGFGGLDADAWCDEVRGGTRGPDLLLHQVLVVRGHGGRLRRQAVNGGRLPVVKAVIVVKLVVVEEVVLVVVVVVSLEVVVVRVGRLEAETLRSGH